MGSRTVLFGVACLAGCSGFAVRSGPLGEPIPGPETGRPIPGTVGDGGDFSGSTGSSRQTVCRGTPYPRGWVSVDYVEGGSTCGSASDGVYSAVVLQRLAPLPQGTLLIVCAGQSIPRNWRRVASDELVSSGQCPRNPGDRRTGSTVMQIERSY